MAYNHQSIEKKWQSRWEESGIFHARNNEGEKFYCLIEFPYPSGAGLHAGHPRSYTALDVIARKKRMEGKNVLYPIGWDAFGLPTENYAIKTGRKPQDVTAENIATFKRQLKSLGISFDWSREINTTDPSYYKWTQWMFLEFFKAGLAYKAKKAINWCVSCKIGLANEEVVNGGCERCGGEVEKRDKEQWMIAITKYADRLLEDLDDLDYLDKIKVQQRNWIGRSEGAEIIFDVKESDKKIEVFTTRPDTLYGATYMVLAPEHELVKKIVSDDKREEVEAYKKAAAKKTDIDRGNDEKEKTGVFTGAYAINPINGKPLPVWIADYVMMGYGTGAIMAVPAHDERDFAFAKKFEIEIVQVIDSGEEDLPWKGDGVLMNSEVFDGLSVEDGKKKITAALEEKSLGKKSINFRLRDWVFSRQRYWGEPIPLVHCRDCGWVPVPESELPLTLPDVEIYEPTDTGESPLAAIDDWVNTICPTCKKPAKRETDTMPNWAGSSWYFLRYCDSQNDTAFASKDKLNFWMPVDLYNGGMEHVTLHLLYSRFWNKFLFDQGHVPFSEPYKRRHSHGMVLAADGSKMSKSKGNGVNPEEIVSEYGADALRMYILFMGPFEEAVPWSLNGLIGVRRFLDKAMRYITNWDESKAEDSGKIIEPHLKKIMDDTDGFRFNTAVSTFMSLFNDINNRSITRDQLEKILRVLCPYAPHIANECFEMIGGEGFLEAKEWPEIDESLLVRDAVKIVVQVNGKLRSTIEVPTGTSEEKFKEVVFQDENVKRHTDGKEIVKTFFVPDRLFNIVIK